LDTTNAKRLAMSQKVMSLPTLAIYKDGEKVETITKDGIAEDNIVATIEKYI
jgi:thioredoxin 1